MNIGYYITDHFFDELNLEKNPDIVTRLNSIKRITIFFLLINLVASSYAFYSLFGNVIITIIAASIFQFIFIMIYIVLFSTVRKAEYLKGSNNKKIEYIETINGQTYRAKKFILEGPGLFDENANSSKQKVSLTKSWSNIFIRLFLLFVLGIVPSFFFGMMLHHKLTDESYQEARTAYIKKQIDSSKTLYKKLHLSKTIELKNLLKYRSELINTIDSFKKNPDPNGYYLEDVKWNEDKLKLFDDINSRKIARDKEMQETDSIEIVKKEISLNEHYKSANFFLLRGEATWKKFPFTFILSILLFMFLLLFPFIKRYSMLKNTPELIDDPLEKSYRKIIYNSYESLKENLNKSEIVTVINDALKDENIDSRKKKELENILAFVNDPGQYYNDPEFKVNHKLDIRKFIEKGNLAKYLGI